MMVVGGNGVQIHKHQLKCDVADDRRRRFLLRRAGERESGKKIPRIEMHTERGYRSDLKIKLKICKIIVRNY